MSFDLHAVKTAVQLHGLVARVVVAEVAGSTPREPGASMLVWQDGQSGTIGGGVLELEATLHARRALSRGIGGLRRFPLGPALGQCCGGAVTLATEVHDGKTLAELRAKERAGCLLRRVDGTEGAPSLAVERHLAERRNGSSRVARAYLLDGWLIEPVHSAEHALWVHGAGHVGRAIVGMIAPLQDWQVTWVDTSADRFPETLPMGTSNLVAAVPAQAIPHAPTDAHHLILTYSHALDLELCHALLVHDFEYAGLIGSESKWTRFRKRLRQLGHSDASIARITCPIGDPALGKEPQAIAIGVTGLLLRATRARPKAAMDRPA